MVADLRATIADVRIDGRQRDTRCPVHEDQRASVSVGRGDDARILLTCHAGCPTDAILAAVGLTVADLFEPRNGSGKTIVAEYDYIDERGTLLYQVVRFAPKDFRQRRPDGAGGWTWKLGDVQRVLYRLPELQGQSVYIAEGEKDVDHLRALGLTATCNAGGAGKWREDYTRQLQAAGVTSIVILPDNDDAGRAHAAQVAQSCHVAGLAVTVATLPDLPVKGDVSDWLAAGHAREELAALAAAAAPWSTMAATVGNSPSRDPQTPRFPRSDAGNAELFAALHQDIVRFDHATQLWRIWTGHHFATDRDGAVRRLVKNAARTRLTDASTLTHDEDRKQEIKWAIQSESRRGLDALLALAQSEQPLAVTGDAWDQNPMLFGVQNGVIDLKTGRLRAGRPEDGITRVSPVIYDARATCARWDRFVREIFATHPEIADYFQRVLGYALTGFTTEQVLWILFGGGGNGKSMLMETVMRLFGADLAWTMPFPSAGWSDSMGEYQKAALAGKRLVASSEVARQGRLNEELIKSLTGTDTVNARHPYGRPFQFIPQAKFFLRVNDKPQIRDESFGMWRRIKLVPFLETFAVDTTLGGILAAEAPGILNWAIRGCLAWQQEGLREPAIVQAATAEYRDEQDQLSEFFAARCVVMDGVSVRASLLYASYKAWAIDHVRVEDRLSLTAFGKRMKARVPFNDSGRHTIYHGVAVDAEAERNAA